MRPRTPAEGFLEGGRAETATPRRPLRCYRAPQALAGGKGYRHDPRKKTWTKGGEFRHGPAPENADVDAATMQRWGFRTAFGATPCRNGVRMNRRFIPQVYLHSKKKVS